MLMTVTPFFAIVQCPSIIIILHIVQLSSSTITNTGNCSCTSP
uniref:Uncharacterized protein n=1 Tax=Arundo donax TaxID=35708 RepID=A0A0A8YE96_ARUDO